MLALAIALMVASILTLLVGGIMFLVAAFRVSALWGVAVLLIPFAGLVFLFKHWPAAKRPFLVQVAGTVLLVLGTVAGAGGGAGLLHKMVMGSGEYTVADLAAPEEPAAGPADVTPAADAQPDATSELPDPKTLIGKTIEEAEKIFGKPTGTMESQKVKSIFYSGFWL
jgi:hypothetical protein